MDGRGIVEDRVSERIGEEAEISTVGIVESRVVGREVFDESLEKLPSSSSAMSLSEDSGSAVGETSLLRVRPRLSFRSSVNVRRRTFRTGAIGVVTGTSGLCIETSSSESLESPESFAGPRLGYKN
jgi:hypothetical protein